VNGGATRLTAAAIATATGGRLLTGDADRVIDGFSIDSRTLGPGDLFFAIVAVRDGHAFVGDALARGAAGAVVSAPVPAVAADDRAGPVLVQVADTTRALQDLARVVRRRSASRVIAITGSTGKTTTKEAIASVLAARYRVVRNQGNLNNHLGLPLSLLELRKGDADVAVMELGMSHAGEIRVLVGIAEPDVRVWTNVSEAHLGHFASVDAVADAKAEILEQATDETLLVSNADDERVAGHVRRFRGRTVTFGEGAGADVRAVDVVDLGLGGWHGRLVTPAGEQALRVPLIGRGNLANALAAAAVGGEMGVPLDEIADRIGTLRPAPRRGAVVRLGRGVTLVDDSYNASPAATRQALDALGAHRGDGRKAAVLGEMLELGARARALHEEVGRQAARLGLARLVTVGGSDARALGDAAVAAGLSRHAVSHAATSEDAGEAIVAWLAPGDVVLVKGSRGIRTDIVVDRIAAEFA
jgi:UDP-N-acetylmuramoyl-tripeptide--D-alanyl-D-alanine ligase